MFVYLYVFLPHIFFPFVVFPLPFISFPSSCSRFVPFLSNSVLAFHSAFLYIPSSLFLSPLPSPYPRLLIFLSFSPSVPPPLFSSTFIFLCSPLLPLPPTSSQQLTGSTALTLFPSLHNSLKTNVEAGGDQERLKTPSSSSSCSIYLSASSFSLCYFFSSPSYSSSSSPSTYSSSSSSAILLSLLFIPPLLLPSSPPPLHPPPPPLHLSLRCSSLFAFIRFKWI